MKQNHQLYNRIISYLKGRMSDRERHNLEKEIMRDPFLEDAFEGLSKLSDEELDTDLKILSSKLENRISKRRGKTITLIYRIAAAIVLIAGAGSVLYFILRHPQQELYTQDLITKKGDTAFTIPQQIENIPEISTEDTKNIRQKAPESDTKILAEQISNRETDNMDVVVHEPENLAEPLASQQKSEILQPVETSAEEKMKSTDIARIIRQQDQVVVSTTAVESPQDNIEINHLTYTGKISDTSGEPLPGVYIRIKGTNLGTITNAEGGFALQVPDSNAVLDLSYIGYLNRELPVNQLHDKEIVMLEDLTALDEVVVVGYGAQRKSEVTGAVSTVYLNEEPLVDNVQLINGPVAPGGSNKDFIEWIKSNIDSGKFEPLTKKQRITAEFTIQTNGAVTDIRIDESLPPDLVLEIQRVISQSPPWKPAIKNGAFVSSEVKIRFVLEQE